MATYITAVRFMRRLGGVIERTKPGLNPVRLANQPHGPDPHDGH